MLIALAIPWLVTAGDRLIRRLSVTMDEPLFVGAGISDWQTGAYPILSGNFYFTQKWNALPLARSAPGFPSIERQAQLGWHAGNVGAEYLFSGRADPRTLIAPARRMNFVFCLLTAMVVGLWAWQIGGRWAGAFAILLYATSPVVLANAVLATSDTGATLWFLTSLLAYGWFLSRPDLLRAIATGAALAILLLSKFLLPPWIVSAALILLWRVRTRRTRIGAVLAAQHIVIAIAATVAIWAFFGFQFRPGGFVYISEPPATQYERIVAAAAQWHVLPEPFLREIRMLPGNVGSRMGYLLGQFALGGHRLYFPIVFLAKCTLAMLAALAAWAFAGRCTANRDWQADWLALAICGFIGYAGIVIASSLNVGVRHILVLFPLAAIIGGVALGRLAASARGRIIAAAIAFVATVEAITARDRPLAWFNAAVGGPMAGYRIAVDSSLEWGADIPDLVAWQGRLPPSERRAPTYACVLGPPMFSAYGLNAEDLPAAFVNGHVRAGYFLFSATRLEGGVGAAYGLPREQVEALWRAKPRAWHSGLSEADGDLAASQLAAFCREREPDQRVGPDYFVYRLSDEDLAKALGAERSQEPGVRMGGEEQS